MNPQDPSLRSPAWVIASGRLIDQLGVGLSVCILVLGTALGSLLIAYPMLLPYPRPWLPRGLGITLIVSAGISGPVSYVLCRLLADLSRSRAALRRIAHVDSLTGAHSRRHFMEAGPRLMGRAARSTVLLFDIDDFKRINDSHGHLMGDVVLREISQACQKALRGHGLFARHGGEEFAVLLPGIGGADSARIARRLRRALAGLNLMAGGQPLKVTASFGVALRGRVSDGPAALQEALEAADRALYVAKRSGKDRICFERGGPPIDVPLARTARDRPSATVGTEGIAAGAARRSASVGDVHTGVATAATGVDVRPARERRARSLGRHPRRRRPGARSGHGGAATASAYRLPCWVALLARFVDRAGRLVTTLVCVLISTIAAALLTVVVMRAAGLVRLDVGLRFACQLTPVFSALISWLLCSLVSDVSRARAILRRVAHVDALTLAHSRRYFLDAAQRVITRSSSCAVVLFDVDNFKAINDRFGHGTGDEVLKAVSHAGRAALREGDLFARYGGEEFVALLPGVGLEAAYQVVERMRVAVASLALKGADGEPVMVTASFGLTLHESPDDGADQVARVVLEAALGAADRALYRAKRAGKNRVDIDLDLREGPTPVPALSPMPG